jgi:hypothetical protein
VCHVSLPSSYRSRRGHIHLLRVLPLVGCWSKTLTIACREGLDLANDLNLQSVRAASDCANAIKAIRGDVMGVHGSIVQELKMRTSSFIRLEFVHEGRRSNVDAHRLARSHVSSSVGRFVWFLSPPDGVCYSYDII